MQSNLAYALMSGCIAVGVVAGLGPPASAAQLHNGWQYAIDPTYDSLFVSNGQRIAGGTVFEIYSMAIKDDPLTNSVWFALNANLPMYGANTGQYICINGVNCDPSNPGYPGYKVDDSNIGWGDLFLDFSGAGSLKSASDAKQLYAIRFSPTNDSRVPSVGLYSNVKATSTVVENAGYSNLWNHNNMLANGLGRLPAGMGDLDWNNQYFAPYNTSQGFYSQPDTQMLNAIDTGNKIAEIMLLDRNALAQAGFESNFDSPVGSEVFGFRVAKSALPNFDNRSFIATLLTECINDGIALSWNPTPPPPPPPPPKTVCPVDPGQLNAVQPTQTIDKTKYFANASSELWYDPPATMGYQLIVKGDGLITEIQGFPCLVDPNGENTFALPFKISAKDKDGNVKDLGIQQPGGNIDIVKALNGSGAKEVIITGIDSDEWDNKPAPAFKLRFDKPNVELLVTEISDTTIPTPPRVIQLPREPVILPPIDPIEPPVGPTPGATAAVPEPTTMAGLAVAAGGLFGVRRRFGKKQPDSRK